MLASTIRAIQFADGQKRWSTLTALASAELAFAETDPLNRARYERQFRDCMATLATANETIARLAREDDDLSRPIPASQTEGMAA